MRKFLTVLTAIIFVFCLAFAACGENRESSVQGNGSEISGGETPAPEGSDRENESDAGGGEKEEGSQNGNQQQTPSEPIEEPSTPANPDDPETESSESDQAYKVSEDGKTVYFGSYPQSRVTDSGLITDLNALGETEERTSYQYYIGGEVSEFMEYVDVEYRSNRYRGVRFSSYRPNDTRSEGTENRSYQDENGYSINETYWFLYETLSWRVLEKADGYALLLSEKVLDSHEFFPAAKGENGHKANDYEASSVREFLNGDFYRTAFSEGEQKNLFGDGDKLYLLSYDEATNAAYFSSDEERALDATDYAKAQGLNMDGGARWWLRSSNDRYDFYARYVDGGGYSEYNQYVYFTSLGVVPALRLKLFDEGGAQEEEEMKDEIFLFINDHKISVKLEQNAAVEALIELLKEGDITYTASDYGGFEKVGNLGHTLPRSDTQMTTEAGDVILYSGNQIVLFYGSNSWSYTKLGHIQGLSAEEWKEILTESNQITVKISLT